MLMDADEGQTENADWDIGEDEDKKEEAHADAVVVSMLMLMLIMCFQGFQGAHSLGKKSKPGGTPGASKGLDQHHKIDHIDSNWSLLRSKASKYYLDIDPDDHEPNEDNCLTYCCCAGMLVLTTVGLHDHHADLRTMEW